MLICLCHPANERDIDACIRDGARSIDDIGDMCGAGTGCGACHEELRERLERAGIGADADRPSSLNGDRPGGCGRGPVSIRSRAA